MKDLLINSVRSFAEESIPASAKDSLRASLADRLDGRVVSYRDLRERLDVKCWTFESKRTFTFTRPTFSNHTPVEISRLIGEHVVHQPFVLEVPDVTLIGEQGIKQTQDGQFVVYDFDRSVTEQAQLELAYDIVDAVSMGTWPFRKKSHGVEQIECAVPLINRWARNYSHWTEECLAQIQAIRHYEGKTGKRPTLLIPPDSPAFIKASLEYFGFDKTDYRELPATRVNVQRMVLPSIRRFWSSTSSDYVRDPYGIDWVREEVFNKLSSLNDTPSKLLISREQDADVRRITNWAEIESTLRAEGFETVTLTELDYIEQKRLFYGADTIVGTHGAGMTELIYAEDAAIVELFGSYVVPPYYEMSQAVGHRYGFIQCEPRGDDLYVDPDTVKQAISAVEDADSTKVR
jgi:hypothetical protein